MVGAKPDLNSPQKTGETAAVIKKEVVSPDAAGEPPKKPKQEKAEPTKSNDDPEQNKPEDATLILSAEEEAEIAAQTNEDAVKVETPAKTKRETQKNVWVSNISKSTKATDLKKLFSENYKVETAKIVTNGKSFFGYICLESPEMAQKSASELNGSVVAGRKVNVTLSRPDLRSSTKPTDTRRRDSRKEIRPANGVKTGVTKADPDGDKKGEAAAKTDEDAKEKKTDEKKQEETEEELKKMRRRDQRNNRLIQDLRIDLKRATSELQNNRRRLTEANRNLTMEKERRLSLRRQLDDMETQLKSERRKHLQEIEQMEKRNKLDEIRYQDDRAVLNKELDECRKLREYLQRKVDEFGISRHGRSPPRRAGPGPRSMSERSSEKLSRGRVHPSDSRGGRSPPPAPKINSRPRDRSPPSYKVGKKPRIDSHPYGNSHYQSQTSSFPSSSKPLLGHYPQSSSSGGPSSAGLYASTAYPDPQRYGSSSYSSGGGYSMGNTALLSRPMGYPDPRSSGSQRKY